MESESDNENPSLEGSSEYEMTPLLRGRGIGVRFRTQLDVSINPTRFARHQPFRIHPSTRQILIGPAQHYAGKARRGADRIPAQFVGEFSLDGSDNWLPQGPRLSFADPEPRTLMITRSFTGFIQEFNERVEAVCAMHDIEEIRSTPEQYVNLKTCETYWEFSSPNPVALVSSLAGSLAEFGRGEPRRRSFLVSDSDTRTVRHSHVVYVDAGPGRTIKVYAKTNQRVRFEVKHRMVPPNAHLLTRAGAAVPRRTSRGGAHAPHSHTSQEWAGIYPMLDSLANDAANLLNRLFAFLQSRQGAIPSPITAQVLVQRVLGLVSDSNAAWALLGFLAHDGRIFAADLPSSFAAAIAVLREAEILERHDGLHPARCFTLKPQYRAAWQNLRYLFQPTMPSEPPCPVELPMPSPLQQERVRRPPDDQTQHRVRQPPPQT